MPLPNVAPMHHLPNFTVNGNCAPLRILREGDALAAYFGEDHVGITPLTFIDKLAGTREVDIPFQLDGQNFVFSMHNGKGRIVQNGFYQDTSEPYAPLDPLPKWSLVFLLPTGAAALLGGVIPIFGAMFGVSLCMRAARSFDTTLQKLLACAFVCVGTWVGIFAVPYILMLILYLLGLR